MLTLIQATNIDFIGKRYFCFALSLLFLGAGAVSLFMKKGPNLGIDFTGGNLVEVQFQSPLPLEEIRKTLRQNGIAKSEIQSLPDINAFIIRIQPEKESNAPPSETIPASVELSPAEHSDGHSGVEMGKKIFSILSQSFPNNSATLLRMEYVGPAIGKHLVKQALWAIIFSFAGIILYIAIRFHSGVWGAAGILALAHDVFATVGLLSMLNIEITIPVVAALLSLAGYSINDTIVIFDRIREKMRLLRTESLSFIINKSINETLSRTILTSLTTFFVVFTLFLFGGEVIHDFAFTLLFGIIVGVYSTIGIAAALIVEWGRYAKKNKKI